MDDDTETHHPDDSSRLELIGHEEENNGQSHENTEQEPESFEVADFNIDKVNNIPTLENVHETPTGDEQVEHSAPLTDPTFSPMSTRFMNSIEMQSAKQGCLQSCLRNPLSLIYLSHALSSWGDRMWPFTIGMLLVDWEHLQSLRLVAIHQLCISAAVFVFGALIGSWVDGARRLRAAVSSIIVQNVFVSASALVLLILMKANSNRSPSDPPQWHHQFSIAIAIFFSSLAYLASVACNLTVVKDWVPTFCHGNRTKLTATNATLKRIDLATGILSPVLAGLAMDFAGAWTGALVVLCWNMFSAPVEIYLLYKVYKRYPQLHLPKDPRPHSTSSSVSSQKATSVNLKWWNKAPLVRPVVTLITGWRIYWRQDIRWSGASLATLYFTVLSFDAITTAYVRSMCVSESVVAFVRIGNFAFGMAATVAFPIVRKKHGLRRSGSIFFIGHACFLSLAVISVFLPGSPFQPVGSSPSKLLADEGASNISTLNRANVTTNSSSMVDCPEDDKIGGYKFPHLWLLTVAVLISRLTLWGTDLSINQMLVERVISSERGVVNGVQGSMNQLVDILRFTTVVAVPHPEQYGYLVIATLLVIICGSLVYSFGTPPDDESPSLPNSPAGEKRIRK